MPPTETPLSVVILDTGSIYFDAIDRVLRQRGWRIARFSIDPHHPDATRQFVRKLHPDLIMIGSWQCPEPDDPLLRDMIAGFDGLILIVASGEEMAGAYSGYRWPMIGCTTAAVDTFLRRIDPHRSWDAQLLSAD